MAPLAEKVDVPLWQYQTPNGSSIIKALDFMAPFSSEQTKWPYPTLESVGVRLVPLLVQADNSLGEKRYQQWIRQADFNFGSEKSAAKRSGVIIEALRETWLLSMPVN